MKVTSASIPDVLLIEPRVFRDARGHFLESFNARTFAETTGLDVRFVQDNQSRSAKGVVRGLHYQIQQPQGKLVRVVRGAAFDVAVDIRRSSPTFGRWTGAELTDDNSLQLWIPPGFAHGFVALSETVDVLYKATDFYAPAFERCILWSDSRIGITWPRPAAPVVSESDQRGVNLADAEVFA